MFCALFTSCSSNKNNDSRIIGEYEFGFYLPQNQIFANLNFKSNGSIDGTREGMTEKNIFNYSIEQDSILILSRCFNGDKIESTFIIESEKSDSIMLKMISKIRYPYADTPFKNTVNSIPIVEYSVQTDSIPVKAYLKRL